ncbi:MAG: transporter substrate-binding domain-containing protein [Gammaproteobacteria bacterium]|nr:transporter substrate-binding domain-containing protein [Gammaproteobacteria bacterium]
MNKINRLFHKEKWGASRYKKSRKTHAINNMPYFTCSQTQVRRQPHLQVLLSISFLFVLLALSNNIFAEQTALSPEEQDWLHTHAELRLGVDPGWPPFDFVNQNGQHDGIAADYLRLLARNLQIEFRLTRDISWKDVLDKAEKREIDIVSLAQTTPSREAYLHFTDPVISSPWVIINRRGETIYNDLGAVGKRKIAMVKGYAIVELSRLSFPNLEIVQVDNSLEGLKMVATGKIEAFVENLTTASYLIRSHGLINLQVGGDAGLGLQELRFSIRSDWPEFVSIFNKQLATISQDEKSRILSKWVGSQATQSERTNVDNLSKTELPTSAIVFFFIIVVFCLYLLHLSRQEKLFLQFGTPRFKVLVSLFIGGFIIVLFTVSWWVVDQNRKNTLATLAGTLETVRDTTSEGLIVWIQNRSTFLSHIGTESSVVDFTQALLRLEANKDTILKSTALAEARKFFQHEAGIFHDLGFFIIDRNAISIASARDTNIGTKNLIAIQRPELLERIFQGEAIFVPAVYSDVALDKNEPSNRRPPTMFIGAPVKDKNGHIIAAITQRLDPREQFSQMLQLGRIGETGETYAIDAKGLLISQSRYVDQLRTIGLLTENQDAVLSIEIRNPRGNMLEGFRPGVERSQLPLTHMASSVLKKEQKTNVQGYLDYRGVPVYGSWRWLDELGIGVTTEIDVDEALASFYNNRQIIYGSLGISLLLSVSALIFTIRTGTRSTQLLKQSHDELEATVAQRTQEIREAQAIEKDRAIALEQLASGKPLCEVLSFLIEGLERSNKHGLLCTIHLYDEPSQTLLHCAAPNLPDRVNKAMSCVDVTQTTCVCGVAVFSGKPVIAKDIESHPDCTAYREFARDANLGACWSYPVLSSSNRVLGTLTGYYPEKREPDENEIELILSSANLAGIAIEKKQSEAALIEAKKQAEQASKAKSEFLSSMSHELRTPLNAIMGFSQLLLLDDESELHKENYNEIYKAGDHLLTLINEILDLAKIESGKVSLSIETVNITTAIGEVLSLVTPLAKQQGVSIHHSTQQDYHIQADYSRIKQVLLNLLSNAIKYNQKNGSVEIRYQTTKDKHLRIEVVDTGIGLSPEQITALFSPFERVGAENSHVEGTGIGLVITKNLVELMGGKIGVESDKGKGSRFWVELPVGDNLN